MHPYEQQEHPSDRGRDRRTRTRIAALATGLCTLAAFAAGLPTANASPDHGSGRTPAPSTNATTRAAQSQVVLSKGTSFQLTFSSPGGQGLLDLTAWAPGTNWQREGDESAVASVSVDGAYQTDLLVPGARKVDRELALGDLSAGRHRLRIAFSAAHSAPQAKIIKLATITARTVQKADPTYVALTHAPIVYGRSLAAYGGPMQNQWTDVPLIGWHYSTANDDGSTTLEYQMVWSNEDGGTDTEPPSEQARWGRMTDIEWIYRVTVDADGATVPGSETYQSPGHGNTQFAGDHEGAHPVLQTCTDNNNVCDQLDNATMRFFLSYAATMDPTTSAREQIMDANPWTYRVMGQEMIREHHTEKVANPQTAELSDARDYLYVVIDKATSDPDANGSSPWVGVSVGVKLKGDRTWYRSDHNVPAWSLQRDGQAATTVELPEGTGNADIAKIKLIRFATSERADPGYTVKITSMNRAYLLDHSYAPEKPYLTWKGSVTLSKAHPTQLINFTR